MATDKEDPVLARFRQMSRPMRLIYARPRTFISLGVGILVCLLLPGSHRLVTRLLFGWDALIAVYLVLVYTMMLCNDHQHIRRSGRDAGRRPLRDPAGDGDRRVRQHRCDRLGARRRIAALRS